MQTAYDMAIHTVRHADIKKGRFGVKLELGKGLCPVGGLHCARPHEYPSLTRDLSSHPPTNTRPYSEMCRKDSSAK